MHVHLIWKTYTNFKRFICVPLCRDVLVIAVVDAVTCLLAGFAIFSILGNLAENQGKSVDDVIQQGLYINIYHFVTHKEFL